MVSAMDSVVVLWRSVSLIFESLLESWLFRLLAIDIAMHLATLVFCQMLLPEPSMRSRHGHYRSNAAFQV